MSRTPIIVGNWKLNKNSAEAAQLVTEIKNRTASLRGVEVGVAPVYVSLQAVAKRLEGSPVRVFAQDCFFEASGAYTGAVSAPFIADAGAHGTIVGHSERREVFGDSDAVVGKKARAGLDAGLMVIVCVGETEAERDAGTTESRVTAQLDAALANIGADDLASLVIAYEPVWAIGTGRTATPAQAQEVHAHIRGRLRHKFAAAADDLRIQYGGSVKPDNAAQLLAQPDIDGALVGGASLDAESFVAIVRAAKI